MKIIFLCENQKRFDLESYISMWDSYAYVRLKIKHGIGAPKLQYCLSPCSAALKSPPCVLLKQ